MTQIKVIVDWKNKKKRLEGIELDTDESVELFKGQIYSQTGVPPERQRIIVKGKILKDDTVLQNLGLKEGQVMTMIGSEEAIPMAVPSAEESSKDAPEQKSDDEMEQVIELPGGLKNLGNTCYMNSTLQCLRSMPELHGALERYSGSTSGSDAHASLTASLRDLFKSLNHSNGGFPPIVFLQLLCRVYPSFAEIGPGGIRKQQDASECWDELITTLKTNLPVDSETHQNFIDHYMCGQLRKELKCVESTKEEPQVTTEPFKELDIHITINTNFMVNGIAESLKGEIEKLSPTLDRTAKYESTSQISRMPKYLTVKFMRFFWKQQQAVRAKILRKVKFPLELDATELCTPELQSKFSKVKRKLKELEDKRIQKERDEKRRKLNQSQDTGDKKEEEPEEKVDWSEYIDPELLADKGCNPTGQYELCAVLAHVGRSADSGHYISWAKKGRDEWHQFDDDDVSVVRDADILKLDGGGDWPIAYILLYRAKELE